MCRSIIGYAFILGSGVIFWCSKRQLTVSLLITEAEYRAAAQESSWFVQLMEDIHQQVNYAIPLYYNNQSTICLAENLKFYARTKHVKVHYHFIKEKVLQEEVEMKYVKTD